jgi:large subunit ribosomal protein L10
MDTKMSQNRQKKGIVIAELAEKVGKAQALVFTNYQGLTHLQIEAFKKNIKKLDAEYAITKNRLLKRALEEKNYTVDENQLDQPTATLFLYGEPVAPLKALAKMIKELQKPGIKFGFMVASNAMDKQMLDEKQVIKLSTLPPKEILLAQLMAMMQSPITGLHRALNWNLQKFVMTLSAIQSQKS